MKTRKYLLIFFMALSVSAFSQKEKYTQSERSNISLFDGFKSYISVCIKEKCDISDSAHLNHITSNYLFIDKKIDSSISPLSVISSLSPDQLKKLKRSISSFYQFFQERSDNNLIDNLNAIPARFCTEKEIYSHFTEFQKANTLIFFDKRSSTQILGYMLFLPVINNLTTTNKIWSWTLSFSFGKF